MSDITEETSSQRSLLLGIVATEVVRPSFARCCSHGDRFFDSFYFNLADHIPDVGPMFAGVDMTRQNQLIRIAIGHLIGYSEGNADSETELEWLGMSHRAGGLNIPLDWYSQWKDTLCQTIIEHDRSASGNVMAAWDAVLKYGLDKMVSMYERPAREGG